MLRVFYLCWENMSYFGKELQITLIIIRMFHCEY